MHRGQPCKCTVGSKRNLINRPFFPVCRKNSMKFDRFFTLIILLPPVSAVEVIKRTCLPVCLCVCLLALSGWTVWGMFKKSGTGIDLDCILDEFDGQGHRSKLPGLKMRLSVFFLIWMNRNQTVAYDVAYGETFRCASLFQYKARSLLNATWYMHLTSSAVRMMGNLNFFSYLWLPTHNLFDDTRGDHTIDFI